MAQRNVSVLYTVPEPGLRRTLYCSYSRRITLSGILQFHNISENRMRGTPRKNLQVFEELCGSKALKNVILTTTYWDCITEELGSKREAQLKSMFWKPMTSNGAQVARFHPQTYESAWDLIDRFGTADVPALKVQEEMVDQGMKLHETSAFRLLVHWWVQAVDKLKGMLGKERRGTPQHDRISREKPDRISQ